MQNEKIGFLKKVLISIKDFEKYVLFASERFSDTLKYFLKLMLIFSSIISIGFTCYFYNIVQKSIAYYNKNIETVEYENGQLNINNDEKIIIENDNAIIQYIEIDTSKNESNYIKSEKIELYNSVAIFLKDKIIVKNPIDDTQLLSYMYEDVLNQHGIEYFNKDQVTNLISKTNNVYLYLVAFISIYVYMFLVYTISSVFDILLLTIVGYVVGRIARIKLRFNSSFNISVHALTLPIILNLMYILFNLFTGFTIKYFGWMYTTISYIYVVVAILMIKTDIINTQIELVKIVKEQENVRKELEQKEEEKQREDNKNEEKKRKDNTNNKDEGDLDSSEA